MDSLDVSAWYASIYTRMVAPTEPCVARKRLSQAERAVQLLEITYRARKPVNDARAILHNEAQPLLVADASINGVHIPELVCCCKLVASGQVFNCERTQLPECGGTEVIDQ
jgi:hypothetical protein